MTCKASPYKTGQGRRNSTRRATQCAIVLATVLPMLLAGCSQAPPSEPDVDITHAHALAYVGGQIYIATHHGLVRGTQVGDTWGWTFASDERFDLMGFTVDRGTFYSSGHPSDPRAYGGGNLGLRRSIDQGDTWEQRSLKGQADFHALTADPATGDLLGFWRNLIRSTDGGLTWENLTAPPARVVSLAAGGGTLWTGTSTGLFSSQDGHNWTKASLNGVIASLAATTDGRVILASQVATQGGAPWKSSDAGMTWAKLAGHKLLENSQVPAFCAIDRADANHIRAGDARGAVIESRDGGTTWKTLRT